MARDSNSSKPSPCYSESERIRKSEREFWRETHGDVRNLAERLVLTVRSLLMLTLHEVNGDERIRDIALLCDECHATRGSRPGHSVKVECGHDESANFLGGCSDFNFQVEVVPPIDYLYHHDTRGHFCRGRNIASC